MRLSTVLGVKKTASASARLVTLGVILFGLLSLGFGVVTFYGLSTGTFVIEMADVPEKRGIQIAESNFTDDEKWTTRLNAFPVDFENDNNLKMEDATYSYLRIEDATNTDGSFFDPKSDYMAYTFYLKNSGNEMVDLVYSINILDVLKELDEYIRVMIIVDDLEGNVTQNLYMKPDDEVKYYPPEYPVAKHFISDELVANETIQMLQVGQVRKITIFMWIEGYDTNPSSERGSIKLDMIFDVLG